MFLVASLKSGCVRILLAYCVVARRNTHFTHKIQMPKRVVFALHCMMISVDIIPKTKLAKISRLSFLRLLLQESIILIINVYEIAKYKSNWGLHEKINFQTVYVKPIINEIATYKSKWGSRSYLFSDIVWNLRWVNTSMCCISNELK